MATVTIGLGSNCGDRAANMATACDRLSTSGALVDMRISSVYESAALLPEDAPPEWDRPFYNQVVIGQSGLAPLELLEAAQRIETQMGRVKTGIWSPRVIDIDILAYDELTCADARLTIPHPQILQRDFVCLPWLEVAPDAELAGLGRLAGLAASMRLGNGLRRLS